MKKVLKKIALLAIVSTLFVTLLFGYMSVRYPLCYLDMIVENSKKYETDPYLIASIINVESRYDENATSKKEAKGLMQITDATGKWGSEETGIKNYSSDKLYDPEINIKIGTWYISRLFKEFSGNVDLVLAAYNAGSGNVNKWLDNNDYSNDGETLRKIPFKETEEYLVKVEKNYKIYKNLYGNKFREDNLKNNNYIIYIHALKKKLKID